jgi:hypothetical protein
MPTGNGQSVVIVPETGDLQVCTVTGGEVTRVALPQQDAKPPFAIRDKMIHYDNEGGNGVFIVDSSCFRLQATCTSQEKDGIPQRE